MQSSSVHVTASGPALSLLLYENTKTPGNQVGFLLGAVVNQVTDTISDSQMRGEKTETIINISSVLPVPFSSGIIHGSGKIDQEKLSALVRSEKNQQLRNGCQSHDIVGWYSFKRNSAFQMSLRERVIHLQLAEMAEAFSQDSSAELFVMCLLSTNSTSKATHVFKHSFMRYLCGKNTFDLLPFQIHNLGMTQATQYQIAACAPSRAALLKEIFDRISPQKEGRDHMLQVQSELQIMLNQRVRELSKAENSRIKLESEIEQLKKQLHLMSDIHTKVHSIPQGRNNGSANSDLECQKQSGRHKNHNRPINRNVVGDVKEEPSSPVCETSENHIPNERCSPVLVSQPRRRSKQEPQI